MARIFTLADDKDRQAALGALGGTIFGHRKAVTSFGALAVPKRGPGPDDWLANNFESGQTFDLFRTQSSRPESDKTLVILQPLDAEISSDLLRFLADLGKSFFPSLEFTIKPSISLSSLGIDPSPQYDASVILSSLRQFPPLNKFTLIALTRSDIYHNDPENYVFSLGNAAARAAVTSLYRFEDRTDLVYSRVGKSVIGRLCHVAGLKNCIYYECVLNGVNNVPELDRVPLHLCPICLRKLLFCFDFNAVEWYNRLYAFFQQLPREFSEETQWLQARISALQGSLAK